MALKQFTIDFTELAKEITLRFDVDFVDFNRVTKDKIIPFKELFAIELSEKKERLSLLDEIEDKDFYYCEIGNATKQGDLEPVKLNFENRNELNENYFTKIEKGDIQRAFDGDILLSKVRPNLKKYIFIDNKYKNYYFTTAFIRIKPKKLNKIIYYSLRSIFYKNLMAIAREGKGYPTLKEDDLYYLKFDKNIIKKLEFQQDAIVAQIEPIEKKIKQLKSQLKDPQEIINKVFAREFGFDLEKFEEAKREKFFEVDFEKIAKNDLLRCSGHFHHAKLNFIESRLKNKNLWENLSNKFNVVGGKRIPKGKNAVNEETGYYYLRPSEINFWGIDRENLLNLPREIYEQLKRYKINTGEFAISIVGTLGKVAYIDTSELDIEENNLILSENFIKLSPKEKLDYRFYYYFFYSFIFQTQIDREYTITSIKKLGIDKWNYIKIPNIPFTQQQKIVDEIKAELDEHERIKAKIQELRNKIDQIIEKAIQN